MLLLSPQQGRQLPNFLLAQALQSNRGDTMYLSSSRRPPDLHSRQRQGYHERHGGTAYREFIVRANHWSLVVPILCLVSVVLPLFPKDPANTSACDVFEILGICDPYVPGTIISFPEKQPIIVISTWPLGPAENAGVCPGDRILAVNGISASENTSTRMLKEIVSGSDTWVHLTVRRGKVDMELDVPRVRESTLAWLSKQKYVRVGGLPDAAALVPLDET